VENIIISLCAKFDYGRLRNGKVLVLWFENLITTTTSRTTFVAAGEPFRCKKAKVPCPYWNVGGVLISLSRQLRQQVDKPQSLWRMNRPLVTFPAHWLLHDSSTAHRVSKNGAKIFLLRMLSNCKPTYSSLLANKQQILPSQPIHSLRRLRSADIDTCCVPRTNTRIRDRSFAAARPRLWNSLPARIRQPDNIGEFCRQLKSFLFKWHRGAQWLSDCMRL